MNLVFVDLVKNIKDAVVLYKKNNKYPNKNITTKEIPKLILESKKSLI